MGDPNQIEDPGPVRRPAPEHFTAIHMAQFSIWFHFVRQHEDIICTHLIIPRQLDENFIGERLCFCFDITVFSLGDPYRICNLLLRQIMIFEQVFDSAFYKTRSPALKRSQLISLPAYAMSLLLR